MLACGTGRVDLPSVNMGQRIITLIVLLAWVPANCHCLLGALINDVTANGCCIESQQKEPAHGQGESGCCDLCGAFESGKFRAPAKDYIDFIEKRLNTKINMISTGPERDETIFMDKNILW